VFLSEARKLVKQNKLMTAEDVWSLKILKNLCRISSRRYSTSQFRGRNITAGCRRRKGREAEAIFIKTRELRIKNAVLLFCARSERFAVENDGKPNAPRKNINRSQ